MNELVTFLAAVESLGVVIAAVIAVIAAVITGLFVFYHIRSEYKRRLIHERTTDFLDDLRKYYMPLGYYSALLASSSEELLCHKLSQKEIDDFLIKDMIFDFGNYFHTYLEMSEKIGYLIFPNYGQKFEIMKGHRGIMIAIDKLIDPIALQILKNISIKCDNNYDFFVKEIDKTEIPKKIKDRYLFSWENVPGNDSERVLKYLVADLDIDWAKTAEICKSENGETISIIKADGKNTAKITINEKTKKATLKTCNGETRETRELTVKRENDKLNIYDKDNLYFFSIGAEFEGCVNNGIISKKLKDVFKTEGFPISENAWVTKDKRKDNWCITDKKIYIVNKEEGKRNIYDNLITECSSDEIRTWAEIRSHSYDTYKAIEESIDSALEPWYISRRKEKKAYKDREKSRKKYKNEVNVMESQEKCRFSETERETVEKKIKAIIDENEGIESYLFSWDNVPGNDSKRLLKFLVTDLHIDWAKWPEISKTDDGKIIHIFEDELVEIMIYEKVKTATLKICNGGPRKTRELTVKKENDKRNIYTKDNLCLFNWGNVPGDDSKRLLKYLETDLHIDWAKSSKISKTDDGKIIRIFGDKLAEIMIDGETVKATLKERDCKICELNAKKEHSKRIIYNKDHSFSWDNVPGDDSEGLLNFLEEDLDIDWAKRPEISKTDDGKIICIFGGEFVELMIDGETVKATLKNCNGESRELTVKRENDKRNIYTKDNLCLFNWDNVPGNDNKRLLKYLETDLDIDWAKCSKIHKIDDGKIIRIEAKLAEITIDTKKEKATLKIYDIGACEHCKKVQSEIIKNIISAKKALNTKGMKKIVYDFRHRKMKYKSKKNDAGSICDTASYDLQVKEKNGKLNISYNNYEKLKNICKLLKDSVPYYNWVGFYLVDKETKGQLVIGPFDGEPTKYKIIPFGFGVCGMVAENKKQKVAPYVAKEVNYIPCSPWVGSEIVSPIRKKGKFVGVLDIDSCTLEAFTEEDKKFIKDVCKSVSELL